MLCMPDVGLWVDKYTPKAFSELLSPEQINREILKEVKQWDKFVFKREVPKFDVGPSGGVDGTRGSSGQGEPP